MTETNPAEPELSELQRVRLDKVHEFRADGVEPYPTRSSRTHTSAQAIDLFESDEGEGAAEHHVTVGGRIAAIRHMGKTIFVQLRDGFGTIQLYLRKDEMGDDAFLAFLHRFDLGDWVEASGTLFRTKTGEISVRSSAVTMLAKSLNAPPDKYHGLQDIELRYRQRYADLIANIEVRRVFEIRARLITAFREYLDSNGYLEVETPVLQPLYGGAAARPFTTHHNALDQTFYLRIADELYLKRLIAGGFERVYEISKDFRNEGVDKNHSPEFTMLEFYEAFADYTTMMDRIQGMLQLAAQKIFGGLVFESQGHLIDLGGEWPRKSLRQAILDGSGVDYAIYPDQPSLLAAARAAGTNVESDTVWPRIVDELLKQFVRPFLVQPTFLVDYPVELSPLAKRKSDDPTHAERFQLYIAGAELANSFTELNDPIDQWVRFTEQQKDKDAGDQDAMPIDMDFINALMYGMPPTGGLGIGIDRAAMVFANQSTIRDVILFPAMRNLPSAPGEADDAGSE
ncbi:MAG: lysine--tRNA ligase [Thermomicrobiales bacterium]